MSTALVNLCGQDLHMYGVGRIHPSAPAATVDGTTPVYRSAVRRNWYADICGQIDAQPGHLTTAVQQHINRYAADDREGLLLEAASSARNLARAAFQQESPRWIYWADHAQSPAANTNLITIPVDDGHDMGVVAFTRSPLRISMLDDLGLTPCSSDAIGRLVIEAAAGSGRPLTLVATMDDGTIRKAMLHRDPRPDRSGPYRMTLIDHQGPIGHFGPHRGESTESFIASYIRRGYNSLQLEPTPP